MVKTDKPEALTGAVLRSLAAVADLARLDLEAAAVSIRIRSGQMLVAYAGAYAAGYRRQTLEGLTDLSVSVSANRFKVLAGMFDDTEIVKLTRTEGGIRLSSDNTRVVLRELSQPILLPTFDKDKLDLSVRIPTDALVSELEAASQFTADSYIRQSLTGIRLDFEAPRLRILGFDGFGALFESTIKEPMGEETGSIVVPREDFILGAKLVSDSKAIIAKPAGEGAVVISGKNALFRSSIFASDWPDISSITDHRDYASEFVVNAGQIRNLITSAKALDTGPDIDVRQRRGTVEFSAQSEVGRFATSVKGTLPTDLKYDRDTLAKVVSVGSMLRFSVPKEAYKPTLVTSEHRRCWIVTRL